MSARKWLADQLKAQLPKGWKIVPYNDALDIQSGTVVMLNQTRIVPNPGAPIASHVVEFECIVLSANKDAAKAEDDLDDSVDDVLHALDHIPYVLWTDAEKVFREDTTGYLIHLTTQTAKE